MQTRIKAADHVITGEGSLDHQSLGGKGPVALARLANRLSVPVTGFCGQADDAARAIPRAAGLRSPYGECKAIHFHPPAA